MSYITLGKKTLIEICFGSPDDYSQLRVFGCVAYAHVDNGKLEPTTIKSIFVGYQPSVKGYKLWDPQIRRLCLVGILFLMSLLCFLTTYLLMLYLTENKWVGRALSSCTRYWLWCSRCTYFLNSSIVDGSSIVEDSSLVVQPP